MYRQTFKGNVVAGNRVVATISRNGDLVHDCFIKVPTCTSSSGGKNFGHNIFDNIELEIGGQLIDKHYGHWMEAHAELTEERVAGYIDSSTNRNDVAADQGGDAGSNFPMPSSFQLTAMAGGIDTSAVLCGEFYVPLRFWFCRHVGLSLPLIALQYHEVNINIKFSAALNSAGTFDPSLWCNYIYLDTDERRRFAQVSHEYLIEQVQMQTFTSKGATGDTLKLNFNHPVKELIWTATTSAGAWGGAAGGGFQHLPTNASSVDTWQLKLNGHDRFEKQNIPYFTRYQTYKYHTGGSCGPNHDSIGVYSFALKPEEHQPSGTCNFSRIDNAQLIYSSINTNAAVLYIYAVNYNVLRIMSGMGGLAYSN